MTMVANEDDESIQKPWPEAIPGVHPSGEGARLFPDGKDQTEIVSQLASSLTCFISCDCSRSPFVSESNAMASMRYLLDLFKRSSKKAP